VKDKVADIIIEKRLRGQDIPFWIKWFFPDVVKEVDPIVRMLKGDKEIKKKESAPAYKWAYALAVVIITSLMALTPFVYPVRNHSPKEEVKVYNMSNSSKETPKKTLIQETATTPTTSSVSIEEKFKNNKIKPLPKCKPGEKCITDPVIPPPEDQ